MNRAKEFLEVPFSHLLTEAKNRSDKQDTSRFTLNPESGKQVGALGELIAEEHLRNCKVEFESVYTTKLDIIYYIDGKPLSLDVKAKQRTVLPRAHYTASLSAYLDDHQVVDTYLFISFLIDGSMPSTDMRRFKKAFILGSIRRSEAERYKESQKAGEVDYSNGFTPKVDTWQIRHDRLNPPLIPTGVVK